MAVSYSGCELHIVESCRPSGRYAWQRTTLATDTVEITDADELYAKLPIGAVSLEGELERSGRLAVRTTVAGQLRLVEQAAVPAASACSEVTHIVSGISVGAFKLLSGGAVRAGGSANAGAVAAVGGERQRAESVMREAGIPATCEEASEEAPHGQCASPIQVFLVPFSPAPEADGTAAAEAGPRIGLGPGGLVGAF